PSIEQENKHTETMQRRRIAPPLRFLFRRLHADFFARRLSAEALPPASAQRCFPSYLSIHRICNFGGSTLQ
ncbi:MAG: hypothetical protein LUE95_04910, partial [Oscillospiraceae bacterium]|nr:hypothetical protein [Oscillospiraceae bacterium]